MANERLIFYFIGHLIVSLKKIMNNIRNFENFYILLWLLKDTSWLMGWKSLGIFMIAPTLIFACLITWKSRQHISDLHHNLAIIFWICANSFWMLTEFFNVEEQYKIYTIIPFSIGFLIIGTFYLRLLLRNVNKKTL